MCHVRGSIWYANAGSEDYIHSQSQTNNKRNERNRVRKTKEKTPFRSKIERNGVFLDLGVPYKQKRKFFSGLKLLGMASNFNVIVCCTDAIKKKSIVKTGLRDVIWKYRGQFFRLFQLVMARIFQRRRYSFFRRARKY